MDQERELRIQNKKKAKKKKEIVLIGLSMFFLVLAVGLLVYYFMSNQLEEPTVIPSPEVKELEKPKLQIVNEDSNERPLAVMIDNNIGIGKHAGLQESYINYEIIVEGGLTRIMALYKDKDVSLIGPVRSSRHYFLDYALEHDAIYAHFGWSPYAENDIRSLGVNNINGLTDDAPYYRDNSIAAPHNVFTSTERLRNFAKTKNYSSSSQNWKVLKYSVDPIYLNPQEKEDSNSDEQSIDNTETITNPELKSASKVSIDYSVSQNRTYTYDSVNEYYLRSMNGSAHIDKTTNKQLNYKNIIIMQVNNKTLDKEGRQDLDTVGTGSGYYVTNGYTLPIKWSKSGRDNKTIYTYNDGKEIEINDGNTFIQIVPLNGNIVIE